MVRVCCVCKKILGEKEPLDDKSVTHTYCEECAKKAWEDIEVEFKKIIATEMAKKLK